MSTLIGSRAARFWFPEFRPSKDTDWITDDPDLKSERTELGRVEYHFAQHPAILEFMQVCCPVANPTMLYTLKMSHIFWNIHWEKNAADILWFQRKGIVLDTYWFNRLYDAWTEVHGKKKAYLNKRNEDFFKDNVNRRYVHDSIHAAMAYYDEPLYNKVKKDRSKAAVSHDMFLSLTKENKLRLCREEIYVTALERFLIPRDFDMNPWTAYRRAVCNLVTSMSKGWFPLFIMENWIHLYRPDIDYVARFEENKEKLCLI